MKINGSKHRMAEALDNVKKDWDTQGIAALDEKLDEQLFKIDN